MDSKMAVIHTRFANDGSVREIGACPPGVPAQDWFNALSRYPEKTYQALSGGRGVFHVETTALEKIHTSLQAPAD